jgi:AraC-like DNA-binding protein
MGASILGRARRDLIGTPRGLRETPAGRMDALSDVLKAVRLTGAIFFRAEMSAPWAIRSRSARDNGQSYLPEAEHFVMYHLIASGGCWVEVDGEPPVRVAAGDLVMFPQGDVHLMASSRELAPVPVHSIPQTRGADGMRQITYGGGGESTRIVCGFLGCDSRVCNPILAALPRLIAVPVGDGPAAKWLLSSIDFSLAASADPPAGGDSVLARLAELLFVEALRRYTESLPPEKTGWFAGLRDRHVGRALALLHGEPRRAWTVDELGERIGLSRSALASRFSELLGEPPMQYLTRWRLQLAAQLMRTTSRPIAAVAEEVGYESEAAFNRAFKREFGAPPAAWRRQAGRKAAAEAPLA